MRLFSKIRRPRCSLLYLSVARAQKTKARRKIQRSAARADSAFQPLRAPDNLTVRRASDNKTIEQYFYVAASHYSMTAPYALYYELALNSYQGHTQPRGALM